jgi:hypothetical protein
MTPDWLQLIIDLRWTPALLVLLWIVLSVALKKPKPMPIPNLSCGYPGQRPCDCEVRDAQAR